MDIQDNLNEHSLAYEMLKHLKADAKRWFIIALVELFIILGITGIFIWYISLPVEEYDVMEQDASEIHESTVTQTIGGYDGKSESEEN